MTARTKIKSSRIWKRAEKSHRREVFLQVKSASLCFGSFLRRMENRIGSVITQSPDKATRRRAASRDCYNCRWRFNRSDTQSPLLRWRAFTLTAHRQTQGSLMATPAGLEPASSASGEQGRSTPLELQRTTTEQGDAHSSLPAVLGRVATREIAIFAVVASLIGAWAAASVLRFFL